MPARACSTTGSRRAWTRRPSRPSWWRHRIPTVPTVRRKRARGPCTRRSPPSPTPSTTRWAFAWTRCRFRPHGCSRPSRPGVHARRRENLRRGRPTGGGEVNAMLRLPTFEVTQPSDLGEALEHLAVEGARPLGGGTDLLPNLKHRLGVPARLVSLARLDELRGIREEDGCVVIGAGTTLAEVADDPRVRAHAPALAAAAGRVASPLIRNMATLGGNVNLDTRCRYVNQTAFWRSAIGGCLKSEGQVCHVVPKGRNCVAAMSSDCVPVLVALGGEIVQRSAGADP
ncbi:MAG: hypothetical protein D6705_16740, partial [Deltaproteobacteria bacterium]